MSAEQDLIQAQATIASMQDAARGQAKTQAIENALQARGDIVPGGTAQLVALLGPAVTIATGVDGKDQVVSVGDYRPVPQLIKDTLEKPEYAHFVRPSSNGSFPAASTSPAPSYGQLPSETNGQHAARIAAMFPSLPGESVGQQIVRVATERRAQTGQDGRLNPAVGFGLRGLNR
jgi:hypothetical protein